jgi:hypothetical protein
MKASELICRLTEIMKTCGDLPVYGQADWQWELETCKIDEGPHNQYDDTVEPKRVILN